MENNRSVNPTNVPPSGIIPSQIPPESNKNVSTTGIIVGIILILCLGVGSVWAMQKYFPSKNPKSHPLSLVSPTPQLPSPTGVPPVPSGTTKLVPPTKDDLAKIAAALRSGDAGRIAAVTSGDPKKLDASTSAMLISLKDLVFDINSLHVYDQTNTAIIGVKQTLANGSVQEYSSLLLWKNGRWVVFADY